jgi:hypothetical protein
MGKRLCTKGTASAVPYRLKLMRPLQAAEKLNSLKGMAFRPSVSDCNYLRLQPPRVRSSLSIRPFSAASLAPEVRPLTVALSSFGPFVLTSEKTYLGG